MYIFINTYMHAVAIAAKRDHAFQGDLGWVYRRVWRDKRDRDNIVIKI